MRRRHRILLIPALFLLAACNPAPRVITRVQMVEVPVVTVLHVDDALTEQHPIATGPLRECPFVARARSAELEACNADKSAIRARHGKGDQ